MMKCYKTLSILAIGLLLLESHLAIGATVTGNAYFGDVSNPSGHGGITVSLDSTLTIPAYGFLGMALLILAVSSLLLFSQHRSYRLVGCLILCFGLAGIAFAAMFSGQTGLTGAYSIGNVPQGMYRLSASATGYQSVVVEPFNVDADNVVAPDIHLQAVPTPTPVTCAGLDFWEVNDTPQDAMPVEMHASLDRFTSYFCTAGDRDWFSFPLETSKFYQIGFDDPGPDIDLNLALYYIADPADMNTAAWLNGSRFGYDTNAVFTFQAPDESPAGSRLYLQTFNDNGLYGLNTYHDLRVLVFDPTVTPTPSNTPTVTPTPTITPTPTNTSTATPSPTQQVFSMIESGKLQHGSEENDYANDLCRFGEDKFYVVGVTGSALDSCSHAGGKDLFVERLDAGPSTVWTRQYGTSADEEALAAAVDGQGYLYVVGYTGGNLDGKANAGGTDVFLMKFDALGNLYWSRLFGTTSDDRGEAVAIYGDRIFITGSVEGDFGGFAALGDKDAFIAVYDTEGNSVSETVFGTSADDAGYALTFDGSGLPIVGGSSSGDFDGKSPLGEQDIFLRKFDADFNTVWMVFTGTGTEDIILDIGFDVAGNLYATGLTGGPLEGETHSGGEDIFLLKTDTDGSILWTRLLGTEQDDRATSLDVLDFTVVIAGTTEGNLDGTTLQADRDAFITVFNATGVRQWTALLGSTVPTFAEGLAASDADHYILAGGTTPEGASGIDIFVAALVNPQPTATPTPTPTNTPIPPDTSDSCPGRAVWMHDDYDPVGGSDYNHGYTFVDSTAGANDDYDAGCVTESGAPDRVYRLTTYVEFNLALVMVVPHEGDMNFVVTLQTACDNSASEIICGTPVPGSAWDGSKASGAVALNLPPNTYYALVDGQRADQAGPYRIHFIGREVTPTPTPTPSSLIRVAHLPPHDYDTISAALDAATSGDTILVVADGNYSVANGETFPLRLKKGVTIIKDPTWYRPVIIGDGNSTVFMGEDIDDDGTEIRGLDIRGGRGYLYNGKRRGGGLFLRDANITVIDCEFHRNTGANFGAGLAVIGGSPHFDRCVFHNNTAGEYGGAVHVQESAATFTTCLLTNNTAGNAGGAFRIEGGSPTILFCTVSENTAYATGGGFSIIDGAPIFRNTIFWENHQTEAHAPSGTPLLDHCCILGGWSGAGSGNIATHPWFIDPDGGNFHLGRGSTCIDAGVDIGVVTKDIDDDWRPLEEGSDIGWDEYLYHYTTATPFPTRTPTPTPTKNCEPGAGFYESLYNLSLPMYDQKGLAVDAGNDVIIGGSGPQGLLLYKYSSDLQQQIWERFLNTGVVGAGISAVAVDPQKNIYVVGGSPEDYDGRTNHGGWDILLKKYDTDGNALWTQLLGTTEDDTALGVDFRNGMLFITGDTRGDMGGYTNAGGIDAFYTVLNPDGNTILTRMLGTSEDESARDLVATDSGEVFITGYSRGDIGGRPNQGGEDVFIAAYNSSGDLRWLQTMWSTGIGGDKDDCANGIAWDGDDALYITGGALTGISLGVFEGQLGHNAQDIFVSKLTVNGDKVWTRVTGPVGLANEFGTAVEVAPDGEIWVTGYADDGNPTYSNYWFDGIPHDGGSAVLMRFDADGTRICTDVWDRTSSDRSCGLALWNSDFCYIGSGNAHLEDIVRYGKYQPPTVTPTVTPTPTPTLGPEIIVAHNGIYNPNFHTITEALAAATSGYSTIRVVADGDYSVNSGEVFPLNLKQGVDVLWYTPGERPRIVGPNSPYALVPAVRAAGFHDTDTVFQGFEITGTKNYGGVGGAMVLDDASLTVRDCYFHDNEVKRSTDLKPGYGGGVYINGGGAQFLDCNISYNIANSRGGGIYLRYSGADFNRCHVNGNSSYYGGGVYAYGGLTDPCVFMNSTLDRNHGSADGGGVNLEWAPVTFDHCTFNSNGAGTYGGGLKSLGDDFVLEACRVEDNSANGYGGGVYMDQGRSNINNTIFAGNYAKYSGGGIYFKFNTGNPNIRHCVFYGNALGTGAGSHQGVGIYWGAFGGGLYNSIIRDGFYQYDHFMVGPYVMYSNILGGWGDLPHIYKNIDEDPRFVDPANRNFHLKNDSPCIDAGSGSYTAAEDAEGIARPFAAGYHDPDQGAYEFHDYIFVDQSGGGDYTTITAALNDPAASYSIINIPDGNYTIASGEIFPLDLGQGAFLQSDDLDGSPGRTLGEPDCGPSLHPRVQGDGTSQIIQVFNGTHGGARGIQFKDGFGMGGGIVSLQFSQYFKLADCIVSDGMASYEGGGIRLFRANLDLKSTTVMGCTSFGDYGGGISVDEGTLKLKSSLVKNCSATVYGGGVFLTGSSLEMDDGKIRSCGASSKGGGLCVETSTVDVADSTIEYNYGGYRGGGLHLQETSGRFENTDFGNNESGEDGGGMYIWNANWDMEFTDCSFYVNEAADWGGGVCVKQNYKAPLNVRFPVFTMCNVYQNSADEGGGFYLTQDASPHISRCRVANNFADEDGGGIMADGDGYPYIENSLIVGNWVTGLCNNCRGGGIYNSMRYTIVLNCTIMDNTIKRSWLKSACNGGGGYFQDDYDEDCPGYGSCQSPFPLLLNNIIANNRRICAKLGGGEHEKDDQDNIDNPETADCFYAIVNCFIRDYAYKCNCGAGFHDPTLCVNVKDAILNVGGPDYQTYPGTSCAEAGLWNDHYTDGVSKPPAEDCQADWRDETYPFPALDYGGNPRVNGYNIDIGAWEIQWN